MVDSEFQLPVSADHDTTRQHWAELAVRYGEIAKISQDLASLAMNHVIGIDALSGRRNLRLAASSEGANSKRIVKPEGLEELTGRELDVLGLLSFGGLSNKEIAQRLFVEEQTVKFHLSHIYKKLGVSNRTQATYQALNLGLLEWASDVDGTDKGYELMVVTKRLMAEKKSQPNRL
jgi:ATP/maltotriose-dependent transcriptional regulator MalT